MRWVCLASLLAVAGCAEPDGDAVELPGTPPGIGFDDLRYSPDLDRVLAPGGRTGNLALVDPNTLEVSVVGGFSQTGDYSGGHDDGPTSVEYAEGHLYVTDRTSRELVLGGIELDEQLRRRRRVFAPLPRPDHGFRRALG